MHKRHRILVVDDDANEALLLVQAFQEAGLADDVFTLTDGWQAIDYFRGQDPFSDRVKYPLPSLTLLDINMPGMNGFDVLAWLRDQPLLADLPVVVLTSSRDPADMERAAAMGANAYKVKPGGFAGYLDLVKELAAAWLVERHHRLRVSFSRPPPREKPPRKEA